MCCRTVLCAAVLCVVVWGVNQLSPSALLLMCHLLSLLLLGYYYYYCSMALLPSVIITGHIHCTAPLPFISSPTFSSSRLSFISSLVSSLSLLPSVFIFSSVRPSVRVPPSRCCVASPPCPSPGQAVCCSPATMTTTVWAGTC